MTHKQNKRRVILNANAELKFSKNTDAAVEKIGTLEGYAMVWTVLSNDRGGYQVRLLPKAATFSTPTLALFQHNPMAVIGNTANGTLRIFSDDVGVRVEIDLPDTSTGRDVEELVEAKYINGMSFLMDPPSKGDFFFTTEGGKRIVNIKTCNVTEVTVTGIPAFSATTVGLLEDDVVEDDEIEVGAQQLSTNREESVRLDRLKLRFMQ